MKRFAILAFVFGLVVWVRAQSVFVGSSCPPPTITGQPVNATGITNSTTNFTVTAANAIWYQWQTNSVNVSNTVGHFGGAQTSIMWITNDLASDSNLVFQCIVANNCGSVTSSSAILTVTNGVAVGSFVLMQSGSYVLLTDNSSKIKTQQ